MRNGREIEGQTTITSGSHAGFDETGALMALFRHGLEHGSITHGPRLEAERKIEATPFMRIKHRECFCAADSNIMLQKKASEYDGVPRAARRQQCLARSALFFRMDVHKKER